MRFSLHSCDQRLRDPALANAGLAGQQDRLSFAGLCLMPSLDQQRQLLISSDEGGKRIALLHGETASQRPFAQNQEGRSGAFDALYLPRWQCFERKDIAK